MNEVNVLCTTNSEEERKLINVIIKQENRRKGSKFIKPTTNVFGSYNDPAIKNAYIKMQLNNN